MRGRFVDQRGRRVAQLLRRGQYRVMSGIAIETGLTVLAVVFSGALLGMLAGRLLPEHHLSGETKSAVSVSMAVLGTLSALVIALLLSTASGAFATRSQGVTQISADLIQLDRLLRRYGPETQEVRGLLRRYAAAKLQDLFPADPRQLAVDSESTVAMLEALEDQVLGLAPADEARRWLRTRALQLTGGMLQTRWLLVQQSAASIPIPFLALMVSWLSIVFASFGLFAPRNMTVIAALFLCAVAVSGAVMMILDLQTPFGGVISIPSAPMRHALEVISR
jgi:hypothetical protein